MAQTPPSKPKRINRAIELLSQGQPIYDTGSHSGTEGTFEQGKKDAQTTSPAASTPAKICAMCSNTVPQISPGPGSEDMKKLKRDPAREDRIHNEAIVDAGPDEQAMSWYYYLEGKIGFPFQARCVAATDVSPLSKGETTEVVRMA